VHALRVLPTYNPHPPEPFLVIRFCCTEPEREENSASRTEQTDSQTANSNRNHSPSIPPSRTRLLRLPPLLPKPKTKTTRPFRHRPPPIAREDGRHDAAILDVLAVPPPSLHINQCRDARRQRTAGVGVEVAVVVALVVAVDGEEGGGLGGGRARGGDHAEAGVCGGGRERVPVVARGDGEAAGGRVVGVAG